VVSLPSTSRSGCIAEIVVLCAAVTAFVVLKASDLTVVIADQNLWYYASYLWAQGVMPYRDFFHSHPPFHILPSTLCILVGGMNMPLLHALPSLIALLSGLLLHRIARPVLGGMGAVIAAMLFLFSHANLSESAHFTGINISVLFLVLAVALYRRGRVLMAGVALGAGAASGVYVAIGAAALTLCALRDGSRPAFVLASAFAGTCGLVNVVFFLIAGPEFLQQVYIYHLTKPAQSPFFFTKTVVLLHMFKRDPLLFIMPLGAIPVAIGELKVRRPASAAEPDLAGLLWICYAMLGAYALFLASIERVFTYYFLLGAPFAAVTSAYVLTRILAWRPAIARQAYAWGSKAVVTALIATSIAVALERYTDNRNERRYDGAKEIAAFIASELDRDETIYGDFGIVPLLAYYADRRVAANEIESSILRFESGTSSIEELIRAIEDDNVAMVISRPNNGIILHPPFRTYLTRNYVPLRRFRGRSPRNTVDVWRRR
jgi:hypothetical protein